MPLPRVLQKLANAQSLRPLALTSQALSNALEPERSDRDAANFEQMAPLLQLQGQRQLIEVIVSSEAGLPDKGYQSMVIAITPGKQELILDELFPSDCELQPGQRARFRHSRDTLTLEFDMQLLERRLDPVDGHSCLVFSLPRQLAYRSRRQYPRLHIDRGQPLTVQLRSPRMESWFATAQNISAGGMRLAIGGNVTDQIERGSLLRQCEFQLSSNLKVRCQARVLGYRFLRSPYRHTQVSLSFSGLEPQLQQQLAQVIEGLSRATTYAA